MSEAQQITYSVQLERGSDDSPVGIAPGYAAIPIETLKEVVKEWWGEHELPADRPQIEYPKHIQNIIDALAEIGIEFDKSICYWSETPHE